jgi:hypothetical protein
MKKIISQNNLEELYNSKLNKQNKHAYEKELNRKRNEGSTSNLKKSIFLSHSHLDKTIVLKIGLLFDRLQADLYVDWMDKSLPEHTSDVTARQIKEKIKETDRFIFLATYHGLRSKWCNWELGIADAINNRMAILPIESKSGKWKGNEYLALYPEIIFATDDLEKITIEEISVKEINGKIINFKEWLFN